MDQTASKEVFWAKAIKDWQTSKLSQQEFCKQNALKISTFGYWKHRLEKAGNHSNSFIKISPTGKLIASTTRIIIPGGIRIAFSQQADIATLIRIIQAIKG